MPWQLKGFLFLFHKLKLLKLVDLVAEKSRELINFFIKKKQSSLIAIKINEYRTAD